MFAFMFMLVFAFVFRGVRVGVATAPPLGFAAASLHAMPIAPSTSNIPSKIIRFISSLPPREIQSDSFAISTPAHR
jgi:hypothetical protein